MRTPLLLLLLFLSISSQCQVIIKYYDYRWKETEPKYARFYSEIEKKDTDSVWHRVDYFIREKRLQMEGFYKDSACKIAHGKFLYFHPNGKLHTSSTSKNGKLEGTKISYYANGYMEDSFTYRNNQAYGTCLSWHDNGFISDSLVTDEYGNATSVSWFDDGTPSAAGRYVDFGKMQGKWRFFHSNGQTSAIEFYEKDKLVSKKYFDESGVYMNDSTDREREAVFNGGKTGWTKFLEKQIYFPQQYKLVNSDKAVVVVSATIDKTGKMTNVEVQTSFYPEFDRIAVNALKRSPNWLPAISHNRFVPYKIRQAVTFAQIED